MPVAKCTASFQPQSVDYFSIRVLSLATDTRVLSLSPLVQFLSAEAPDRSANTRPNEVETVVGSMHERKKLSEPDVRADYNLANLTDAICFTRQWQI